jgi:hypothetical protein
MIDPRSSPSLDFFGADGLDARHVRPVLIGAAANIVGTLN